MRIKQFDRKKNVFVKLYLKLMNKIFIEYLTIFPIFAYLKIFQDFQDFLVQKRKEKKKLKIKIWHIFS